MSLFTEFRYPYRRSQSNPIQSKTGGKSELQPTGIELPGLDHLWEYDLTEAPTSTLARL